MGAHSYCGGCGAGMDAPTAFEAYLGHRECGQCFREEKVTDAEKAWIVFELSERVEALEKQSSTLEDVAGDLRVLSNDMANDGVAEKWWRPVYDEAVRLENIAAHEGQANPPKENEE